MHEEFSRLLKDTALYLKQRFVMPSIQKQQQQYIPKIAPHVAIIKNSPAPLPVIKPIEQPVSKPFIELNKPAVLDDQLNDVKKGFAKNFPSVCLEEKIPSDERAKEIASAYKTKNHAKDITILVFNQSGQELSFLKEVAKALNISFYKTALINAHALEKEDKWDFLLSAKPLKLIIASDYGIWQCPKLLKFYKEIPSSSTRLLKGTPLFLLPDLSLYLKKPLLKRSLWNALCQIMQTINT